MSTKYNHYARDLQAAFLAARKEYADAYEKLQKAEADRAEASLWREEKYIGENAARKARAEADYLAAKAEFDAANNRVWGELNRQRAELRAGLQKELRADGAASPDAIDGNALELLKSGIMTPDDYYALLDKYDNNPTMLRMIGKYAQDAADDMTDDRAARGALLQVSQACKDGQSSVMRTWDGLSQIVDYCSGQAHGRKGSPGYVISMGKWWEQLAGESVENF